MTPQILNGGDITIGVPLIRAYLSDGSIVRQGIDLSSISGVQVSLVGENNTLIPVTFEGRGQTMDVHISSGTSTPGYYGLKITGKLGGRTIRSYQDRYFKLVQTEEEATATANESGIYVMTEPMIIR